jgi:hypothetical protein
MKARSANSQDPSAVSAVGSARRSGGALTLAAIAASLLALTLGAAGASAVIVRAHHRAIGYQPVPTRAAAFLRMGRSGVNRAATKGPLEYHGGPVMSSNTNYAVYWDPSGGPAYPAGYETGLDTWFEDVAHDSGGIQNTDSVLVQYGAIYSSSFGGALIDTDPYPANGCTAAAKCLTDEQLRGELSKYVKEHKLPADLAHAYFLLTPPGVESCFEAASRMCSVGTTHPSYCAYHTFMHVAEGVIVYGENPYIAGSGCDPGEEHPNGNASDATIGGGLAHEHSEALTDPELNAWYAGKSTEVADKCATAKEASEFGEPLGKAPNGSKYNQVLDGDLYWYQQEWSNEAGACLQRSAPPPPAIKKLKPKKGPLAGGTTVTIEGKGLGEASAVKFGPTPAASFKVESSTTITAVSPAGSGTVDVTVTTAEGTSPIVKKDRFKYKG